MALEQLTVETGHYGRMIVARVKPNCDLIESVEALCRQHEITRAVVRSALGSLVDARLIDADGVTEQRITGPGVEILNVNGEFAWDAQAGDFKTVLSGLVAGTDGKVHAGRFKRGGNLAFITMEVSLQEWVQE